MPKATLKLPSGTVMIIEGTVAEVNKLVQMYEGDAPTAKKQSKNKLVPKIKSTTRKKKDLIPEIIKCIKDCDDSEAIEEKILDRTSMVDRTLLPLYMAEKHIQDNPSLSSGDIAKVLKDLGTPIAQPNIARTLGSTASKYVIGDKVKKQGRAVQYRLSRRGKKYIQSVLSGT